MFTMPEFHYLTRNSASFVAPRSSRWERASYSVWSLCFTLLFTLSFASAAPVDFNREIRPILSENCFYCHGQDPKHREAELRLDSMEEATRDLGGYSAIVPGKPELSELLLRLTTDDTEEVMPPPKSNRHVSKEQITLIKRWIAEGATYQKHWAFIPPVRPEQPQVNDTQWAKNDVDRFVLTRLEAEKLNPSPEAKPETWLRRASFDLIGLPPTPKELDDFLADITARGEAAYAAAADRLLASEHFGERLAIDWLDAARYADTHGFNNDAARIMWRWRDWVIEAFNANKPYDQFITEQLAGDLLPQPTLDQKIATAYNRNHVINSEGGIIEEEYRVEYVADRVRTLSMSWMGLTMECSRCHDHKYDPITQKDYYQMFAFFNQVPEFGEDGRAMNAWPMMPAPTRAQAAELERMEKEVAALDAQLKPRRDIWKWQPEDKARIEQSIAQAHTGVPLADRLCYLSADNAEVSNDGWTFSKTKPSPIDGVSGRAWSTDGAEPMAAIEDSKVRHHGPEGNTIAFWVKPAADNPADVALLSNQEYGGSSASTLYNRGQEIRLVNGEVFVKFTLRDPAYAVWVLSEGAAIQPGAWNHIAVTYSGGLLAANIRIFTNGRELPTRVERDGFSRDSALQTSRHFLAGDGNKDGAKFRGAIDEFRAFSRALNRPEVQAVLLTEALPYAVAQVEKGVASASELEWLRDASLSADAAWNAIAVKRDEVWENYLKARRTRPTIMVMNDLPEPRKTHLLKRGLYDAPGEEVDAGVPEKLLAPWPEGAPRNRLGLARWLTRPDHPLTARVVVNRFWAQLFGTGLVKTLEDFGFQAEWPSHPELLDWLAREFVDSGWNVKALYKTLVLSATYRQNSGVTPELFTRDPENRLLARGPRVRLPAELIRDQALAISGLLKNRLGGPSVYPYQPAGLYVGMVVEGNYPGTQWVESTGDDLFRRSLYTFWKRTVPHPSMLTFDAPDREFCAVRRSRTNTPLQALTLMNDPTYVQSSRELAKRMQAEGGADDTARVTYAFRLATSRAPGPEEIKVLTSKLQTFRESFTADPAAAAKLSKTEGADAPELAALTSIASIILNLDETITKN